jgi:hypothetical protein
VTINEIKHFLLWCLALNYAILLTWSMVFIFAHDWMYRFHTCWFKLSVETFDSFNYRAIAIYKNGIILLNLIPLAALYLAG